MEKNEYNASAINEFMLNVKSKMDIKLIKIAYIFVQIAEINQKKSKITISELICENKVIWFKKILIRKK